MGVALVLFFYSKWLKETHKPAHTEWLHQRGGKTSETVLVENVWNKFLGFFRVHAWCIVRLRQPIYVQYHGISHVLILRFALHDFMQIHLFSRLR